MDEAASAGDALDGKPRELIALAVAVTTRCDGCIGIHAEAARRAGASQAQVAQALATAIALNSGAPTSIRCGRWRRSSRVEESADGGHLRA